MNAGVPEAEFYLDGNFVAVTDAKGSLTMENFPAGSFSYSLVKRGYNSYTGSFSIGEGETRLLSPALEKIPETTSPPEAARKSEYRTSPPIEAKSTAVPRPESAPKAPQDPIGNASAGAPIDANIAEQNTPGGLPENSASALLWIAGLVLLAAAILITAFSIRRGKRMEEPFPRLQPEPETATLKPPIDAASRPDPGFIEELKRREELINAGFIPSKPQVLDPQTLREKEVIIVLPKEAFRVEDDK